jgi:hypothetical protein
VRERIIVEDREEGGGRDTISPEKRLKAFNINQSGVRERIIMEDR